MMFALVSLFVYFDILLFIENRECPGVDGRVCCDGYTLNDVTKQCEKCPIGYHRHECSEKCIYPVYGEDCQNICECNKHFCDFAFGCSDHVTTATDYDQLSSTTEVTIKDTLLTSTVKEMNISVAKSSSHPDVSQYSTKYSDSTRTNFPKDTEWLTNSFVVYIAISLIGVFVFFFAIFVLTYLYIKCFRNTTNTSELKENDMQAHYKPLVFDTVVPQIPLHPEPQERVNAEYLTPVFSCNDCRESCEYGANKTRNENENLLESQCYGQRDSLETSSIQNEPYIAHADVQGHVYIEIKEDNAEILKLDAYPYNKATEI